MVDILPTIVDIAGGDHDEFDGKVLVIYWLEMTKK